MEKAQLDALLVAHGGRAQPVASLHILRALRASSLDGAASGPKPPRSAILAPRAQPLDRPTSGPKPRRGGGARSPLEGPAGGAAAPFFSAADHAFLVEHAASLATIDLSRWLGHAVGEQRPAVLEALIALAEREPARFEFEIARAPHFPLRGAERTELIIRLVGRVPETLIAALSPEPGGAAGAARPAIADHPAEVAPPATDGVSAEGFFDPSEILAEMDFDPGGGGPAASGLGDPAAGGDFLGLGDSLGEGDFFGGGETLGGGDFFGGGESAGGGDPLANGGFGGHSRSPEIDALLADLPLVKGPRARTAWKKRALAAAETGAEDWAPSVTRLPVEMRDAILVRASISPRGDERAALLEWLFQNGGKRAKLVELTVALLDLGDKAVGVYAWLSRSWLPRLLADKASWGRHGAAVLGALADKRAFSEMDDVFAAVATGAGELGPGLVAMPGAPESASLQGPIAAAFGAMLTSATRAALESGHRKEALAGAAALACLGVPSKDRASLATLRRKKAARGEIATLLALAEARARPPKKSPRLEDLVATVHVLSDAMS